MNPGKACYNWNTEKVSLIKRNVEGREKYMSQKWQRLMYMPAVPMGEDGRRLTAGEKHIALAREAAAEGMVLLKNEGGLLPFAKGTKLALFGKAQADYVKGGGGSGDTTVSYVRSLIQGLEIKEREGKVSLFAPLNAYYTDYVRKQYTAGAEPGRCPEAPVPETLLAEVRRFTDTAVIALCRFSGEGWDRSGTPYDGDFYLSREEEALAEAVKARFPHVAVVLNTGGMMDTSWFRNAPGIQSALLAWQGGIEGGLAEADILCGDVTPSGRLTDTFAMDFAAYPSSDTFNESQDYVTYNEDIFVGYRYFETVPGAAEKVCYPFGYGLSYTAFALEEAEGKLEGETLRFSARIRNTGGTAGKQVLQIYAQPPQGKLGKARRVLIGFAKTRLLQPGETETLTVSVPAERLASYDDTGAVCLSAWVLEQGAYHFFLGDNVRDAGEIAFVYEVKEDTVLAQCAARCRPRQITWRLKADGGRENLDTAGALPFPAMNREIFAHGAPPENIWNAQPDNKKKEITLSDVAEGKATLDQLLDTMSVAEMASILGGQPNRGAANTFGVGGLNAYGIPNVMTADGPAGLRIRKECGVTTTAFPCATLIACTWNEETAERIGAAAAEEVKENGIGVWLAPGMNIHRNPLCGRNFEYFSEDPLVSGKMAAAVVRGVQSRGVSACVKHFACNNKEVNRTDCDSRLSERALREIYLKGFEIAVKEAQPWTLMTSYNIVNGVRASENREMLTDILRGEWGYQGLVITDWWNHSTNHDREVAAGNDVKMPRGMPEKVLEAVEQGTLDPACVRASTKRLLEMILKLD